MAIESKKLLRPTTRRTNSEKISIGIEPMFQSGIQCKNRTYSYVVSMFQRRLPLGLDKINYSGIVLSVIAITESNHEGATFLWESSISHAF